MRYRELTILLPCRGLDDFPVHHKGEEAAGLLACWSALWHPALLVSARSAPKWRQADDPPQDVAEQLVVVPSVSEAKLPAGFLEQAASQDARLICSRHARSEIVDAALEGLDEAPCLDDDIAADFLALGYCRLQIELLTRQLRYSSNLDAARFDNQAVDAATAAASGDLCKARERLAACFDLLSQERDYFYPSEAHLLDLTLVAPSTIGESLRRELAGPAPVNLLVSGEVLALMAERAPETLELLKKGLEEGRVGLVGGEAVEGRSLLLPCEAILGELRRGLALYEELAAQPVRVFGRRRFGLTPALPQILQKLGFLGAIHATLEDGRFPEGSQVKIRWEGADGSAIDAVARAPLDASRPETFLGLAGKLGESLDRDHVATMCIAHWPGCTSVWREDLRRISKYGSALGKLVAVERYFRETDSPSQAARFKADQYRSPYLKQCVQRGQVDAISTSVRYWQRRLKAESQQTLYGLATMISGGAAVPQADWLDEVDQTAEAPEAAEVDVQLDRAVAAAAARFAAALPRHGGSQPGCLVANPLSFPRRVAVETPASDELPSPGGAIYAAGQCSGVNHVIVDVPPMGYAWVAGRHPPSPVKRSEKVLAEDCSLRNEFLEARIDRRTGALRSLYSYNTRGNRLSQQLAFRLSGPASRGDAARSYSVMAADSVEVTAASTTLGEITSRGRLLDWQGNAVAGFRQQYRLWRGSRVLQLDMELDPHAAPGPDPWHSYYACRFAWASEAADLWRAVHHGRQPAGGKQLESPLYLEIDDAQTRTSILTGGLPFHRRQGRRMLDCLLIVRGERARTFRVGIGVDLRNPIREAISFLAPPVLVRQTLPTPTPSASGWLFHLDARNVVATYWGPLVCEGRVEGFRVRLLETAGRSARLKLTCFRAVSSASQVDFRGRSLGQCRVDNGAICLDFSAHQWMELEARW